MPFCDFKIFGFISVETRHICLVSTLKTMICSKAGHQTQQHVCNQPSWSLLENHDKLPTLGWPLSLWGRLVEENFSSWTKKKTKQRNGKHDYFWHSISMWWRPMINSTNVSLTKKLQLLNWTIWLSLVSIYNNECKEQVIMIILPLVLLIIIIIVKKVFKVELQRYLDRRAPADASRAPTWLTRCVFERPKAAHLRHRASFHFNTTVEGYYLAHGE